MVIGGMILLALYSFHCDWQQLLHRLQSLSITHSDNNVLDDEPDEEGSLDRHYA